MAAMRSCAERPRLQDRSRLPRGLSQHGQHVACPRGADKHAHEVVELVTLVAADRAPQLVAWPCCCERSYGADSSAMYTLSQNAYGADGPVGTTDVAARHPGGRPRDARGLWPWCDLSGARTLALTCRVHPRPVRDNRAHCSRRAGSVT